MARNIRISADGKWIDIAFNGGDFTRCLQIMKSTDKDGKRFATWSGSMWRKHYSEEALKWFKDRGWVLLGDAHFVGAKIEANTEEYSKVNVNYDKSILPKELRNYQIKTVDFAVENKGNGILALPMGSGKTACSASVILALGFTKNSPSKLIVCPAGLKNKWKLELKRWAGIDGIILSGKTPNIRIDPIGKVYIINYEILSKWVNGFMALFDMVIADEAHRLANNTAQWTKNFKYYFKNTKHKIFLTGTPAKSKTRELFTMLNMLAPKTFHSEDAFLKRYCGPVMTARGITYDGSSNEAELHALIKPLMIRFNKEEILPELPSKNIIVEEVDAEDVDFKEAEDEWIANKARYGEDSMEAQKSYKLLSRSAYALKREYIKDMVTELLEEGRKVVIGAWHHAVVDDLKLAFPDALVMDGRVPSDKRQEIEDKFQKDEKYRIIIGQLSAAGEGFEFTASEDMVFAEIWSVPSVMQQFMDRIHRLTSKGKQVNYYFPVVAGSIEEEIIDTLNKRVESLSKVLDGVDGRKFI